ncbi:hypothetical protein [Aquimarina sp. 2304DJ70-9]|uniref:hypothetical protein n=1 Tax=Aquimarina penaris TaxID=3231044 RepID=UPI0034625BC6
MNKNRTKPSHRIIAVFFTLTFLQTLIPYNQLWANNNGPNAPEAAAFEPVDATDMVNLLTGDFSYVLPLLNVPSPEGGYPLALSYHGGIAHNQEASWTGLGWNLNPGSINRNVNGFPDDWGKTKYKEFFYDAGFDVSNYNFSVGVDLYGVNIGIGAAWGSHRSTSGHVSIGYGYNGFNANVTIGTDGASIGVGYNNFNASFGTNGVGIGYGLGKGGISLGVGLNYSYSSGVSGNLSLSANSYSPEEVSGKLSMPVKGYSLGVSFSDKGTSVNISNGYGLSTNNNGTTAGDYDEVGEAWFQIAIPIYAFFIGYGHRRDHYSLYKKNTLTTSGSVYPYHANETKPFIDGTGSSFLMKENYFMDVNEFPAFSHKDMSLDYLVEQDYKIDKNNISLPGYDSYTVTSQGLSGSITPASYNELNLVDRGRGEANNDNIYTAYVADNFDGWLDRYNDLGGYTNFYFENEFSSFLRIDKSNIYKESFVNNATDQTLLNGFKTANTNTFSQDILPNGDKLKSGNRKRTGRYVETFTNKQIRENINTSGFIEAKNIHRNVETNTFLDEGIGAFRITALDGKTYHYSLPVYNFEIFYKNFKNPSNEDEKFFEIEKTKPYATHWLLTAITGPDYVDVNTNGEVDKGDYGYWVEFDYGKWSDGYIWRSPFSEYEIQEDKENPDDTTYYYYWGRKQIYYLDAITTRSHKALFVKSLRADNHGKSIEKYKEKIDYSEGQTLYSTLNHRTFKKQVGDPEEVRYGQEWVRGVRYNTLFAKGGKKASAEYMDIPKNRTLKLDKIILLKNGNIAIDKSRSNNIPSSTGYLNKLIGFGEKYENTQYSYIPNSPPGHYNNALYYDGQVVGITYDYFTPTTTHFNVFQQHISNNVIDSDDIVGLDLEQNTVQVIDFNYDYSLAQQSPNSLASTKGRLSLKSVRFKGKKGISLIPPYKFSYDLPYVTYNKENQDEWGYHKTYPQAWSLNEITTPTGGKIKIQHEPDSYYSEAAYTATEKFDDIEITKTETSKIVTAKFNSGNINLLDYFQEGIETELTLTEKTFGFNTICRCWIPYFDNKHTFKVNIISVSNINKELTAELILPDIVNNPFAPSTINTRLNDYGFTATSNNCERVGPGDNVSSYCYFEPILKSTKAPNLNYTNSNPNGKKGGGIRVASIEVKGENTTLKTIYDYTNLENNNISGITSYAPSEEQKGIPYVSELPAPLVTYGNVTMKNYDANNEFLGSTSYKFDVLKPYEENPDYIFCLGDFFKVKEQQDENFFNGEVRAKKYTIYNKISDIGRVLSVASKNRNGQLLNKSVSNYKVDLDDNGQIGVSQQSYKSIKKLKKDNVESFLITSSSKVDYPSVIESTTNTQGGFTNSTYYDKYDFLTGQVTETRSLSSEGAEIITKITPAYQVGNYTNNTNGYSMGAKVDNPTNKNMLTQTAATLTQIKGATGGWKTINADITTWNNNWTYRSDNGTTTTPSSDNEKIWRKHKTFARKGQLDQDGAFAGYTGDFDGFNWNDPDNQTNRDWIKTSTVSLYDHYSMPLESIDINGNKASTKMGDDFSKVFAVANAGYNQMYYSGAEDLIIGTNYFSGEVSKGSTATLSDTYHTGSKALQVAANVKAFAVQPKAGQYKASVWVHKNNNQTNTRLRIGGTTVTYHPTEIIPAGDWVQLNFYTGDIANNQEVYIYNTSGTAIYDDFRLLPVASSMSSYVYNEWDELTYIIGANNMATKYEYDDAGRLKKTYHEVMDTPGIKGGFKLSKEINYNYGTPTSSNTTNPNALSVNLGIGDPNVSTTTLTATANGGSYEYEYRWAISTNSNSFSFGSWTTSNTTTLTTSCGNGGRRYYKCEVRDKNSRAIVSGSGNHQRGNCGIDGEGDPIEIIQQ